MAVQKLIPFLFFFFLSCSSLPDKSQDKVQKVTAESAKVNSDTLIINKKAAIFYAPDSLQIVKRKKEIGEETFYTGADDYLYYMHLSYDFLDSAKMFILDAKDKKFLRFIYPDKSQNIIKLDTLPELWGVYFFTRGKKEKAVDMTAIEEEYKNYFN